MGECIFQEWRLLKSQDATSNTVSQRSPSRSSSSKRGKVKPPKAFTEKEELMGG